MDSSDDGSDRGLAIIDQIYNLLAGLDEDYDRLHAKPIRENRGSYTVNAAADIAEYLGTCDAVDFLEANGFGNRLGLSEMDDTKIRRLSGTIDATVLSSLINRLRSFLYELEGSIRSEISLPDQAKPSVEPLISEAVIEVRAIEWVRVPKGSTELIGEISELLDEAIYLATATNLPPDQAALTKLERAQLVALLETALAMLKGPMVEKGLLKRTVEAARSGAESVVKSKTELALGYGLGKAAEAIGKFLGIL